MSIKYYLKKIQDYKLELVFISILLIFLLFILVGLFNRPIADDYYWLSYVHSNHLHFMTGVSRFSFNIINYVGFYFFKDFFSEIIPILFLALLVLSIYLFLRNFFENKKIVFSVSILLAISSIIVKSQHI